mgnify:CR=1 FL=1
MAMTNQPTETMQSPLHNAVLGRSNAAVAGIRMCEYKFYGHLNLRGDPAKEAFLSAVRMVLGLVLPSAPCSRVRNDTATVHWLGPNEWLLLVTPGHELQIEADLRAVLVGQHAAVVDISSAQMLVNLSGTKLPELLQKSTVYDCDSAYLPVGKVVQTTFAKTIATLCRCEDGSIDLIIRRSFADYFMLWLQDTSAEYGLAVVDP